MKKQFLLLMLLSTMTYLGYSQDHGLIAKFWDNQDFIGDPVLERIDSTMQFDAGGGSVDPLVPADGAGMLWKGQLKADYTETYKLILFHNDGGRVWLDGNLLIDNWSDGQATNDIEVDLVAGQLYDLVVEIYEGSGTTRGSLSWSSPSVTEEIIPNENLYAVDVNTPVSGIILSPATLEFVIGGEMTADLKAEVIPGDAANQNITWASTDEFVATVDNNGLVTAVAEGSAKISVTTEEGGFSDTCDVTVLRKVGLIAKFWDNEDYTGDPVAGRIDSTLDFDAGGGSVDPAVPDDGAGMRWEGRIVPDFSETYTFTLFHNDGGRLWLNGELLIDNWSSGQNTDAADIDLVAGEFYDLVVKIYEGSGTTRGNLKWSSNSQTEEIIPYENLYAVDVNIPETGITIEPSTAQFEIGGDTSATLTATVSQADATNKDVTWTSDDESVIVVDNSGVIAVRGEGMTNVVATTANGEYSDTCVVTVERNPGLFAAYYNNVEYDGDPAVKRTDATIDFSFGSGSADPAVNADNVGMVWKGKIRAGYSETYNLILSHNDGARLWLDGELLIDNWEDGINTDQVSVDMVAGEFHELVVKIYEGEGSTAGSLKWSSPSVTEEVIPSDNLFAMDVNIPVTGVTITPKTADLIVGRNESISLEATVHQGDATNKNLIWESTDPAIARVDALGTVTAASAGTVKVSATSEDGSYSDTCVVNVSLGSSDADLASLSVSAGTLTPAFSADETDYALVLPPGSTFVDISAEANDPNASVVGNGTFYVIGEITTATVAVTAEDGTKKMYVIAITVAISDDATLSALEPGEGSLNPAFSSEVTDYTLELPMGTTSVGLTATPSYPGAIVTGDGTIDVSEGSATATIEVTAEDGTKTMTYTVDISVNTAVDDLRAAGISLYPNPARSEVVLNGIPPEAAVQLINSVGQVIMNTKAHSDNMRMNVSGLRSGIYLIRIELNGTVYHSRLMVE